MLPALFRAALHDVPRMFAFDRFHSVLTEQSDPLEALLAATDVSGLDLFVPVGELFLAFLFSCTMFVHLSIKADKKPVTNVGNVYGLPELAAGYLRERLANSPAHAPAFLKELDKRSTITGFPHFPNAVLEQALRTANLFSSKPYDDALVVLGKFFDVVVEHKCFLTGTFAFDRFVAMLDTFFTTDHNKSINETFNLTFNSYPAFCGRHASVHLPASSSAAVPPPHLTVLQRPSRLPPPPRHDRQRPVDLRWARAAMPASTSTSRAPARSPAAPFYTFFGFSRSAASCRPRFSALRSAA